MKVLIIRFSSIGDIVLTTPIIRCLKIQLPETEIHYVTKSQYRTILEDNPYIEKIHSFEKNVIDCLEELKAEKFDLIIDLHKNLRSKKLLSALKVKSVSFPKKNVEKWLLTQFKINRLPEIHIVDRYFESVKSLGVIKDELPCDYFIREKDEVPLKDFSLEKQNYIAFAIGAQFATKRLPVNKIIEIVNQLKAKVVLLGGKEDIAVAQEIVASSSNTLIVNCCGTLNLNQSAWLLKNAKVLITHDTGLMHIASCFEIPIISVWGNTVTDFGMYPYAPLNKNYTVHEVGGLPCRPCSKIGYDKCPKKHFNCMELQNVIEIAEDANSVFNFK